MSKFNAQLQNDIAGAASGMMTQMLCAERGIDYNNLLQAAQQTHMQGILQAEQQRQMQTLVKRHYQGESFIGKIASAFGNAETNLLMPVPAPQFGQQQFPQFGQQPQFVQQPQFPQQSAGMNHMQAAQYLVAQPQAQMHQAPPVQDSQVADLQDQLNQMKSLLSSVLYPQPQPAGDAEPLYAQQQPPFVPQQQYKPATNDVPQQAYSPADVPSV